MKFENKFRPWKFVALGLCQAISPAAFAQSTTASVIPHVAVASPSWGWQAQVGVERAWRVQYRGSAQVDYRLIAAAMTKSLGDARVGQSEELTRAQTLGYDIDAVLHTRVISVDAGGWVVAAQLSDVRFVVDGQADSRKDLFQAPFLVNFDTAGRMGALSFMNKYPEELKRAVTRIVEPMQVAFAAPNTTRWVTAEQGVDTNYTATYELTPGQGSQATLLKNKTRITRSVLDQTDFTLPGTKEARIGKSETKIAFDLDRHTIARVDSNESTSLWVGGKLFTSDTHTFTASEVTPPALPLARTLATAQAGLADPAFARARLYDVDLHTRPLVQGLDEKGALSAYRRDVASNTGLGVRELSAWLRLNPTKSLQLAHDLDGLDPAAEERAFSFGWASLATAGHSEAQSALLQVATGSGWKPQSQEQALIALMSLELPEAALVTNVWNLRRQLAAQPLALGGARLSITTNVYGALGDVSKGSPSLTAEVVRNLGALLADPDPRQQVLALDALSNVGDETRVAPLIAPFLASHHETVRKAAFGAYRKLGAGSLSAFTTAFAQESSAEVRLTAVRTAAQMPDSEALAQWARSTVLTEPDAAVKGELVHLLGAGIAQHAVNAQTLRALLQTTHERRVRRDIYVYVAPTAGVRE